MNILTAANLNPFKYGNFEKYCVYFTKYLLSKGHTHQIMFIDEPISAVRRDLENAGAKVIVKNLKKLGVKDSLFLSKYLKENKVDIIHLHFYTEHCLLTLLMKFSPTKCFITYHISGDIVHNSIMRKIYKTLRARIIGSGIDKVFCVSKYAQKRFITNFCENPKKTALVYNGVDVNKFSELATKNDGAGGKTRIICVANLIEAKGIQYFIKSIPLIADRHHCEFIIVGDGPYRGELERLANELDIAQSVHFYGLRNDVPLLYLSSDVAVVPSIWQEACPYSIIEAMAVGLPIIATNVGGNPELVLDGENGIIVNKRDERNIADAIKKLLTDKELRKKMGKISKERVLNKFNFELLCEKQLSMFS